MDPRARLLSDAVDRFCAAIEQLGPPDWQIPKKLSAEQAPDIADALAKIKQAIAPSRLPPELIWLWETWDVDSFDMLTDWPPPDSPSRALWTRNLWAPDWPLALFPIVGISGAALSVELLVDDSPRVSAVYMFSDGIDLVTASLADLFDAATQSIEAGHVEQEPQMFHMDHTALRPIYERQTAASDIPQSMHGPFDWYDAYDWPETWKAVQCVTSELADLRGPTCSIAELNETRKVGLTRSTIAGDTTPLTSNINGRLLLVEDGTDSVEVFVPVEVLTLGRDAERFEFDVRASASAPGLRFVETQQAVHQRFSLGAAADSEDLWQLKIAHMAYIVRAGRSVVAIAVRPIFETGVP